VGGQKWRVFRVVPEFSRRGRQKLPVHPAIFSPEGSLENHFPGSENEKGNSENLGGDLENDFPRLENEFPGLGNGKRTLENVFPGSENH